MYGEWLVPHSLKTYREDAWRKFYIFDVCITEQNIEGGLDYLRYEDYIKILEEFELDYIPLQSTIKNPSHEQLYKELEKNQFLIRDGEGCGEGIVIKNYNFTNKYGRKTWAKIVTSEFKDKHRKEMGHSELQGRSVVETVIVEQFCTRALIDKTYAKIKTDKGGWSSKFIPMLLSLVYREIDRKSVV